MSGITDDDRDRALADVIRTYEAYAETGYDARWSSLRGGMRHVVAERDAWLLSHIEAGATVLDIGCGDGHLGLSIARVRGRAGRYVGVDLLEERLAMARERVPWGEFRVASADRLPIADGSVDVVAAITLLSSIAQPWLRRAIAGEVSRILRPGGRLLIYDLRYASPRNPAITPVRLDEIAGLFPGWRLEDRALGLLPPIARSRLASASVMYRLLTSLPVLRSHIGIVVHAPAGPSGGGVRS